MKAWLKINISKLRYSNSVWKKIPLTITKMELPKEKVILGIYPSLQSNYNEKPKLSQYHTIDTFCIFCTVTVPE